MADSPNKTQGAHVRCSVYSEGAPLGSTFCLISAQVRKEVNGIGSAQLIFEAGDMPGADIPESNDDKLAVGKSIRVEVGYDGQEASIFEGVVTSHGVRIAEGNKCSLNIECRDYAFATTMGRKSNVFEKKTDGEIIKAVLGKYSKLSPSVDSTTGKYQELVQYYSTDWDFVRSRADANGLVICTEGKDISVKKPDVGGSAQLKLKYGADIIAFEGEVSADAQLPGLKSVAWDDANQKMIKVTGSTPTLNKQGSDTASALATAVGGEQQELQAVSARDSDSLTGWANAQLLKAGLSRISGSVKFCGSSKVKHGGIVELEGFGKHFNGSAYVGAVEHEVRQGEWTTTVEMGLPYSNAADNPAVSAPPASGLLPGIQGLHVGKVTKLDADPTEGKKIQVEIFTLNGENNKLWARLSGFWASNGYGAFFIPDVGDEVVVGFFNSDPCYPVVLGSLYSAKQKPPYELSKENKVRVLQTKAGLKIEFNDEKKVISIQTPGKNVLTLSDDAKGIQLTDQNKNKIAMDSSGIVIESAKNLTLKAKMNVVIDAGANLESKAKSNLTMKGLKIEGAAQTQMVMKGTAQAEFSASGQTVIKGAMVMIN